MCVCTDELAILRMCAGLGAVQWWSVLRVEILNSKVGTDSALSTITAASCEMPRGSLCATLT